MFTTHGRPRDRAEYSIHKALGPDTFLVKRCRDGETFVASPFGLDNGTHPDPHQQSDAGSSDAETAALNVLNHENLVSVHAERVCLPVEDKGTVRERRMLLWDWCDAGTLAQLLGEEEQVVSLATVRGLEKFRREKEKEKKKSMNGKKDGQDDDNDDDDDYDDDAEDWDLRLDSADKDKAMVDAYDIDFGWHPLRDRPRHLPALRGFLPESLVWHVGLSLLRALQWLHEGVRDAYLVERPGFAGNHHNNGGSNDYYFITPSSESMAPSTAQFWAEHVGATPHCARARRPAAAETDWMPILHRQVRARNVFMQHPRGSETYGAVKLGGLEMCAVSGKTAGPGSTVPLVALAPTLPASRDETLADMRDVVKTWEEKGTEMQKHLRPYTRGTDLYGVGAILYHMMTRNTLPGAEECILCGHNHVYSSSSAISSAKNRCTCEGKNGCRDDVDIDTVLDKYNQYTAGLRDMVRTLLRLHRDLGTSNGSVGSDGSNGGDNTKQQQHPKQQQTRASEVLDKYWPSYNWWLGNSEDGQMYVDEWDDMWIRGQNAVRETERRRALASEAAGVVWRRPAAV